MSISNHDRISNINICYGFLQDDSYISWKLIKTHHLLFLSLTSGMNNVANQFPCTETILIFFSQVPGLVITGLSLVGYLDSGPCREIPGPPTAVGAGFTDTGPKVGG